MTCQLPCWLPCQPPCPPSCRPPGAPPCRSPCPFVHVGHRNVVSTREVLERLTELKSDVLGRIQLEKYLLLHHSSSLLDGSCSGGQRLLNRAALPLIKHTESLWNSRLMVTPSSSPVCLARALPILFSSVMALGCQAPRLSIL